MDVLHTTRFVHTVDAPSLAMIVPVLHRALKDRSTDAKKKAALIVGNMCAMINDPKAVQPYVDGLLPVLRKPIHSETCSILTRSPPIRSQHCPR